MKAKTPYLSHNFTGQEDMGTSMEKPNPFFVPLPDFRPTLKPNLYSGHTAHNHFSLQQQIQT
jgi:hypothetical protein